MSGSNFVVECYNLFSGVKLSIRLPFVSPLVVLLLLMMQHCSLRSFILLVSAWVSVLYNFTQFK